MDEESVRKVGDDTVGGPAISRQLRLIRILMRDLLIGVRFLSSEIKFMVNVISAVDGFDDEDFFFPQVNYLHSHGLAHTELRLENVHISPVDRHIKVRIIL